MTASRIWIASLAFATACGNAKGPGTSTSAPPDDPPDARDCWTNPVLGSSPPEGCSLVKPPGDCTNHPPGYYDDLEPILTSRCKLCHAPAHVAKSILFDTYEQARSLAETMYVQVLTCQMPPSCAGLLDEEERTTILRWYLCKSLPVTPAGDAGSEQPADGAVDEGDAAPGDGS